MMTPQNDRSYRDTLEPIEVEQLPMSQVVTHPPGNRGGIGLSGLVETPVEQQGNRREQGAQTGALPATGWGGTAARLDGEFRRDYETSDYAQLGYAYDTVAPAYQFGYHLGTAEDFKGHDWEAVEPEARSAWEERNPGTWEQLKAAARHAWDKVTGSA